MTQTTKMNNVDTDKVIDMIINSMDSDKEFGEVLNAQKRVGRISSLHILCVKLKTGEFYGLAPMTFDEAFQKLTYHVSKTVNELEELNKKFKFRKGFYDFRNAQERLNYVLDVAVAFDKAQQQLEGLY